MVRETSNSSASSVCVWLPAAARPRRCLRFVALSVGCATYTYMTFPATEESELAATWCAVNDQLTYPPVNLLALMAVPMFPKAG